MKPFLHARQAGLSLVELMVSLLIGLIVVGGLMTVFVNSRGTYSTSEDQAHMLDGARYAMHVLSYDLRMAGGYGQNSWPSTIEGRKNEFSAVSQQATGDCASLFYADIDRKIFAANNRNPFSASCIDNDDYQPGTDVLVVRYASPDAIADDDLVGGVAYVQAQPSHGRIFVGATAPSFSPNNNYALRTHVYYVSPNTEPDDGIPALRRISLIEGPEMEDEVIVSGVENFQVQFGIDECEASPCDGSVNHYVDADNTSVFGDTSWTRLEGVENIRAVNAWVLMRAETATAGFSAPVQSYSMANNTINVTDDGFRRKLFSSVFNVRNVGRL